MERTGEITYERALPRRFLRAGRGKGAQTPPPRPAPPPPLSSSATKSLTDADHFGMIRTAQRRFAPTVIGITRNSDRHQIGMSDRHRRNTHRVPYLHPAHPVRRTWDKQNRVLVQFEFSSRCRARPTMLKLNHA